MLLKIAAVALAVLFLAGVSAQAKDKKPKKKKNQDLSANPLANVASKQPDKELFDKAMVAMKKGRFDVARLDLQTMLNTYPDSEYRQGATVGSRRVARPLLHRPRPSTKTSSPSSPRLLRLPRRK